MVRWLVVAFVLGCLAAIHLRPKRRPVWTREEWDDAVLGVGAA